MIARSLACMAFISVSTAAMSYFSPATEAQPEIINPPFENFHYEKILRQDWQTSINYAQTLRFANCVTRIGGHETVSHPLTFSAGTSREWVALNKVAQRYGSCAPVLGRVDPAILRGALAEALWEREQVLPKAPAGAPTGAYLASLFETLPHGDTRHRYSDVPMAWLGRCAAFTMPDRSTALVRSEPGSVEEKRAVVDLIAASDRCGLRPTNVLIDVSIYRAAVADGLYLSSNLPN
ncbi:hypothetical protein G7077_12680 [Sphingomonas piscis]|uniref:Uncharacterized protein n=1 Tax=Sphingomonas piscis TaxID=2714943 RepID=A0A6G7YSB6_9SPHN|nr:hypothetical protein [Sphingomonas piscis]QIK79633.1 hypothetical protein G7077_12680 [Sphingomonas piscis]